MIKTFFLALKKTFINFKLIFSLKSTHNRCDSCGFTKDEVFVTEYFMEGGYIQCKKCYNKEK